MQEQLEDYKQSINTALTQFFADVPELLDVELTPHSVDALHKIEEYSLRPGKRIRGALAAFAYDYATGQKHGKGGIQAAIALELVQNYLLIIDDIMDRSVLRRGKPTIHELYLAEQSLPKDSHLANMLAMNVGLLTQHLVNIVLSRIDEDPVYIQKALFLLHKNIIATGFGQIEDATQFVGVAVTEENILQKYTLKSGYYTFVCPLQLGLVLGGKNDPAILREITNFGLAAGVAFQIKDDMLGIFAATEDTGKPNTDDIEEGKYTLLVQYALTHSNTDEQEFLKGVLGKQGVTKQDVLKVQQIFQETGAKQYTQEMITRYADRAKDLLKSSSFWNDPAKNTLNSIIDYSVYRQR